MASKTPQRRRSSDLDMYDMSRDALDKASEASELIKTHIAVCSQQNVDILRRLGNQDKILWVIATGVGAEILHLVAQKLFG